MSDAERDAGNRKVKVGFLLLEAVSPLSSSRSLAGDRAGEVVTVGAEATPKPDDD